MENIFDFTKLSSDDESTDEEAEIAQREETLRRQRAELEENEAKMRRRRAAREEFEEGRFAKATKVESENFEDVLLRNSILLDTEDKAVFKAFIPKVVEFFDKDGQDFREKMAEKKHGIKLSHFINSFYESMVAEGETPENIKMHEFLVKFHKEVFNSLREMTPIPKSVVFSSALHGNVFREAKEKALKELASRHGYAEKHAEMTKREEEKAKQEAMIMDQLTEQLEGTSLIHGLNRDLASVLASMSLEEMTTAPRDTSPPRHRLSADASELARQAVSHLKVTEETRNGATQEKHVESDEEDFGSFLMGQMTVAPEPEPEPEVQMVREIKAEEMEDDEHEEEVEEFHSDESDVEAHGDWRTVLGDVGSNPIYFGKNPSREDMEDWESQRFQDKHLARKRVKLNEKKGVKFAPFYSPLNTMRIFVKPHGHFFLDGDDGPRTDHVDLKLKDGWKAIIRKNEIGPLVVPAMPSFHGFRYETNADAQKVTLDLYEFMRGYHGNLLGRFWFDRDPKYDKSLVKSRNGEMEVEVDEELEEYHSSRRDRGFLRQYTHKELEMLYLFELGDIHKRMKRGFFREARRVKDRWTFKDEILMISQGEVARVLILTDWRLAHINKGALVNACFKFMPTNLGAVFFASMSEFLSELLLSPNIEIDTIIFAFGGSPRFKKEHFLTFFKRLTAQTLKRVDVFWIAQDWWDGLQPSEQQKRELDEFNAYVKRMFEAMRRTGHRNYKWFDVREERMRGGRLPLPAVPDIHSVNWPEQFIERTVLLEPLYSAFLDLFVTKCNCYAASAFWMPMNRHHNRHPENEGYYPKVAEMGAVVAVPFKAK